MVTWFYMLNVHNSGPDLKKKKSAKNESERLKKTLHISYSIKSLSFSAQGAPRAGSKLSYSTTLPATLCLSSIP